MKKGFTLIELLVVIAIIGILASIISVMYSDARNKAYMSKAVQEFRSMYTALTLYQLDHSGSYPLDVTRGIEPLGLGQYLAGGWPKGPWPHSVYDYESWKAPDPITGDWKDVYQISVRFCDYDSDPCTNKPSESWAKNFTSFSSVYYCISGPCRAHQPQSQGTWGYCVNCGEPKLRQDID